MINCCLNILLHLVLATLYGLIKSFSERGKTNKVEKKKNDYLIEIIDLIKCLFLLL